MNNYFYLTSNAAVQKAISERKPIAITGGIGRGKTFSYRNLLDMAASANKEYSGIDEVYTEADTAYVNSYLNERKGQGLIFTSHIKDETVFKATFPSFTGLKIHLDAIDKASITEIK